MGVTLTYVGNGIASDSTDIRNYDPSQAPAPGDTIVIDPSNTDVPPSGATFDASLTLVNCNNESISNCVFNSPTQMVASSQDVSTQGCTFGDQVILNGSGGTVFLTDSTINGDLILVGNVVIGGTNTFGPSARISYDGETFFGTGGSTTEGGDIVDILLGIKSADATDDTTLAYNVANPSSSGASVDDIKAMVMGITNTEALAAISDALVKRLAGLPDLVQVVNVDADGNVIASPESDVGGGDVIGPGADRCTLTFNNTSDGLAIADADVWITTDAAGTNTIAGTLQTNTLGKVTFLLDATDGGDNPITYYVWLEKDGVNSINGSAWQPTPDA